MPGLLLRARSFRDDESGSMVLFGIYLFCAMLLLGGLSLTVIAHEATRVRLQNTIDMAVLAAADLNQELDPENVVTDYFEKANLVENLKRVKVTESLNSREVLAEAEMSVDTFLLNGITANTWMVNSIGAAREDISNIEVSLVLDTSGSMSSYGRMDALKEAAKDFVDDILLTATETEEGTVSASGDGEVSISIIPYSTQVSMPQIVLDEMNLDHRQSYSGCVDFEEEDFLTTALPTTRRNQTSHFDPLSSSTTPSRWICAPDDEYEALLFSQNATELKEKIEDMEPYENTSIDVGLKWGAAMLDPSAQDVVDALIDAGMVDDDFEGRPYDYTKTNKMKVLVVMTDGANTTQYKLDESVASGLSDVWEYNGVYSVFAPDHDDNASLQLNGLSNVMPTRKNGNSCNSNRGGWNNGGNSCDDDDDDDDADDDTSDNTADGDGEAVEQDATDWFYIANQFKYQLLPSGGLLADHLTWPRSLGELHALQGGDRFPL